MVPSLTAVDADGVPLVPGLLYGDERGRTTGGVAERPGESGIPTESGELLGFLRWCLARGARRRRPVARGGHGEPRARRRGGARHVHRGRPCTRCSTGQGGTPRSRRRSARGPTSSRGSCRPDGKPGASTVTGLRSLSGCIDALVEQLVAGADGDGDVLVLLGTTLIVWAVAPTDAADVPGFWTIPHTAVEEPDRRAVERGRDVLQLGQRLVARSDRTTATDPVAVFAPTVWSARRCTTRC